MMTLTILQLIELFLELATVGYLTYLAWRKRHAYSRNYRRSRAFVPSF